MLLQVFKIFEDNIIENYYFERKIVKKLTEFENYNLLFV